MADQIVRNCYQLGIKDINAEVKAEYITVGNMKSTVLTSVEGARPLFEPRKTKVVLPDNERCAYVIVRGANRGQRCTNRVEGELPLCSQCKMKKMGQYYLQNLPPKVPKPPPKWSLKIGSIQDFSSMREARILTDITLVSADGDEFFAHKLILIAASPYFEQLLMNDKFKPVNGKVEFGGVSSEVFKSYLDLLYGKEVILENWRDAFDIYEYFGLTLINWNKDQAVIEITIPPSDYLEYIERLYRLYEGGIPPEVVKQTKKFINSTVDLNGFNEEFVKLIESVPHPYPLLF